MFLSSFNSEVNTVTTMDLSWEFMDDELTGGFVNESAGAVVVWGSGGCVGGEGMFFVGSDLIGDGGGE